MRRNEHVAKIMTSNPQTVHLASKVTEVAKLMNEGHFHHVPVVDGDKLIGMISAHDLARASYEWGSDSKMTEAVLDHTRTIESIMSPGPVSVKPSTTIREATEILTKGWFHALPVVDEDQNLQGVITTTDVLNYLLEQM